MVVIVCIDKMIDTVECPLCKFYEWKLLDLIVALKSFLK